PEPRRSGAARGPRRSRPVRQRHVRHGTRAAMMGGPRAPNPAAGSGFLPFALRPRPATERGRSMKLTHDTLRVLETHVYRGPSAWGYRPMTRMVLDLGVLEDHPSSELPDFPEALLERLPGLHDHGCC